MASNPERVIKWLRQHIREPISTYFAYDDASVQDIKAAARAAGFIGNTQQSPWLPYMAFKSRLQGFALKLVGKALFGEKGDKASDAIGTLHVAHWVPFENNRIGFFTIFDGDFGKYIQDFAEKTSFVFDAIFPHIIGGPPTPVAKNTPAFIRWAEENNYPAIGFYSAYPGLSVLDIRALMADRKTQSALLYSSGVTWSRRTNINPEECVDKGERNTSSTGEEGTRTSSSSAWPIDGILKKRTGKLI